MNNFRAILVAAAFVTLSLCAHAQALPTSRPGFVALVQAAQPDGKMLVAGMTEPENTGPRTQAFGIERLNADGSIDTTFHGGLVRVPIWGYAESAYVLAVHPDG